MCKWVHEYTDLHIHNFTAENIQFRFSICDEVDRMIDEEAPKPLTFPDISPRLCAEQLTLRDAVSLTIIHFWWI